MKHRNDGTRAVALAVLFSLVAFTTPVAVAADGEAWMSGVVLDSADQSPVAGVEVLVGSSTDKAIAASEPTAADGSFRVSGLKPGTYQIGIRSDSRIFLVEAPVTLSAGENRPFDVLIDGRQLAAIPGADAPTAKAVSGVGTVWDNPLTAALLVIGGAVIIGVIVDELDSDDDPDPTQASPF